MGFKVVFEEVEWVMVNRIFLVSDYFVELQRRRHDGWIQFSFWELSVERSRRLGWW